MPADDPLTPPPVAPAADPDRDGVTAAAVHRAGAFDPVRLRAERLRRVRRLAAELELDALVLFDPNNQRYATGTRSMFGYALRSATRYVVVPQDGPVVLFEYPGAGHVSAPLETIDEVRPSQVAWSAVRGRDTRTAGPFAAEVARLAGGRGRRVGLDRCPHRLALALQAEGVGVGDVNGALLHARRLKTADEIECLKLSAAAAEAAVAAVEAAIRPGVSETELFALMVGEVIRHGGEMVETRLLSSGPRTNPWFNEAGSRLVRPGELVALDTDTIGCEGYYADISRTFLCRPGRPTAAQRSLYAMAWEQVHHNMALLRPGLGYRELAERAWRIPDRYRAQRYPLLVHGVGLHGETPTLLHLDDFGADTVDGTIEPGMVLSVESYVGEAGGAEGVKLEEAVVVTDGGIERISRYPFDEDLLVRHV